MSAQENERIDAVEEIETIVNNQTTLTDDVVFINREELSRNFIFTNRKPEVKKELPEEEPVLPKQEEIVYETKIKETKTPTDDSECGHVEEYVPENIEKIQNSEAIESENQELRTTDKDSANEHKENALTDIDVYENDVMEDESVNSDLIDEDNEKVDEESDDSELLEDVIIDKEALQQSVNENIKKFESKKKTQQMIAKIASGCLWAVGIVLLILCCSNLYQQMFNSENYTGFFGVGNAIVVSNSMEPNIKVNDLVFYKNTDIDNIAPGDVIVYKSKRPSEEERLIVHRVTDIADGYVTTQGDNNATTDAPVEYENVIGKYMFRIGGIGAFFSLMATKWAPLIAVAIIWAIIVIRIAIYFVHKKKVISEITEDEGNREALDHFFNF